MVCPFDHSAQIPMKLPVESQEGRQAREDLGFNKPWSFGGTCLAELVEATWEETVQSLNAISRETV